MLIARSLNGRNVFFLGEERERETEGERKRDEFIGNIFPSPKKELIKNN